MELEIAERSRENPFDSNVQVGGYGRVERISRIAIEREEYRESVGKRNLEKKNLEERTRLKKIDRTRRTIYVVGFEIVRRIICM